MNKIAEARGAEHRGSVRAGGGYFGAMQLVASLDDQRSLFDTELRRVAEGAEDDASTRRWRS